MTSARPRTIALWLVVVAVVAGIAVLDVMGPAGIAIPMLYVLPLLATWGNPSRRSTRLVAGITVALTVLGAALAAHPLDATFVAERLLTVVMLLLTAVLLDRAKHLRALGATGEEQLQQSEERFSAIHDRAPFAIALTGIPDGRTVSVNDAFLRIFGCSREEAIGRTGVELGVITPGMQALVARELLERGGVRDLEVVRTTPSGDRRAIVLNIDKVRIGSRDFVLSTAADVTRLKLAEERWQASERRLRFALDAASAGVWDWDLSTGRIECDGRCRGLLGVPPGVPVTRETWFDHLPEAERRGVFSHLERALAPGGEDSWDEEFPVPHADGTLTWVGVLGQVERDEEGRATRLSGIGLDISSRKLSEQQLKADRDEMERRVEERTEELRLMASELTVADRRARESLARTLHDGIQQLIFGTRLQVERLLRSGREAEVPARDELRRVVANLDEALEATRTLSVDLFPPVLRGASVNSALEWLAYWMRDRHGLDVRLSLDPTADVDWHDGRALIFESVRELLFNVVKHAGVLAATVETAPDEHGLFRVTVADEGLGFDASAIGEGRRGSGAATGLVSIHERLSLMGGRLTVQSAPHRGTRVTLVVPRRASATRAGRGPATAGRQAHRRDGPAAHRTTGAQ